VAENSPPIASSNLKSVLESLLFVARKPLSAQDIQKALCEEGEKNPENYPEEQIVSAISELVQEYQNRGVNVIHVVGGYIMASTSQNADCVHRLLHTKVLTTLSPQALETLSIIAYKQPVTRAEIDRIRGVCSDGPVETLLSKKLIQEMGRGEAVGRPYLYGTTDKFLRHFGLNDLASLPPLPISQEDQEKAFRSALHE